MAATSSGPSGTRSASLLTHSAVTSSGATAPARTVAITNAVRSLASWCTTVAEASSSR